MLNIIGSIVCSWLLMMFLMPVFLSWIKRSELRSPHREDAPDRHQVKAGTPTMGGCIVFVSMISTCLIFGLWNNRLFWAFSLLITGLITIGWYDDYLKLTQQTSKGISSRMKFIGQSLTATLFMCCIWFLKPAGDHSSVLFFPVIHRSIDLGWGVILWGIFLINGSSNAVNLTDGLDSLASMIALTVLFGLGLLIMCGSYSSVDDVLSPLLGNRECLYIMMASLGGSLLGFLWFNANPAQVFLGDVGSLTIGGFLAGLALVIRQEIIFGFMSMVFVIETVSVMLQVLSFKLRKKRIFKMAPIHHHFELTGWSETTIVMRFWIITCLFILLGLALVWV